MTDARTTISQLRQLVAEFVDERDWQQFHAPKNITMALAIEAAELMEHFQWIDADASRQVAQDPAKLSAVGEELADVVSYSLALANALDIDVAGAVRAKMVKNAIKYPVEDSRRRPSAVDER